MKTLVLKIDEKIYDRIIDFLSLLPNDKIVVRKVESESKTEEKNENSFREFHEKWYGSLKNKQISPQWKEEKINYISNKHD